MTELPELPDHLQQALARRIADHYGLPVDEAATMLDDVIQNGRGSAHMEQVWQAVGRAVHTIINEIKAVAATPDAYSPEAVARVVAATSAALPELQDLPT